MTQEEIKMRDNIALVAMQCLLNRKKNYNFLQRVMMFFVGYEYLDEPAAIANEAYDIAQSMMDERESILKAESEV